MEEKVEEPKKHPLENAWTLWFFKEEKDKDWIECYKKVASFTTVEDFWALYNFIMPPSKLAVKCEYSVFKVRSSLCILCLHGIALQPAKIYEVLYQSALFY